MIRDLTGLRKVLAVIALGLVGSVTLFTIYEIIITKL